MKKRIVCLLCILLLVLGLGGVTAWAEEDTLSQTQEELMQEQYDAVGADDLASNLPDNVQDSLEKNGLDSPSSDKIISFSIGDFFSNLWGTITDTVKQPLGLLAISFGVMLLCALLESFKSTVDSSLSNVFSMVAVLAVCGTVIQPVIRCIQMAADTITGAGNFMLCFIPVFTGIVTASGMPVSGLGYNTALFATIQVISKIVSTVLLPFLGIFLALSIVSAVSGQFKISKLTATVKKTVVWSVSLLLTIFIGIFSTQSMVAASADTVTVKATKFMVGSFIPVVGGAISDALNSVQGCLGLMKSSIGAFGILACVFTFLPAILTVLFYMLVLKISSAAGSLFGLSGVTEIFDAVYDALSILMAFLICYSLLTIVTTTLMISMSSGG